MLNLSLAEEHLLKMITDGRRTRQQVLDVLEADLKSPFVVGTTWEGRVEHVRNVVGAMSDADFDVRYVQDRDTQ